MPAKLPDTVWMTTPSPLVPYHDIAGVTGKTGCGLRLGLVGTSAGVLLTREQALALGAPWCKECMAAKKTGSDP